MTNENKPKKGALHRVEPLGKPSGAAEAAFVGDYVLALQQTLGGLDKEVLAQIILVLEEAYEQGRAVFLAGNGGSASTCAHFANDLLAGVAKHASSGFKAQSLCENVAVMTCLANDYGYDQVFSRQLRELAAPGDVFIAVSGSGNSPNIVAACAEAKRIGMNTVALLGKGGGEVAHMSGLALIAPSDDYGIIEDAHMAIAHLVSKYLKTWAAGRSTLVPEERRCQGL